MSEHSGLGSSTRANDFLAIAGVVLVGVVVMLRGPDFLRENVTMVTVLFGLAAYAATILRRDWRLLAAGAGLIAASVLAMGLASLTGAPWRGDGLALLWLVVVWMPWPTLQTRRAVLVLWALAWGPLVMVMLGPPLGDISWAEPLLTGERLEGQVGFNEIGIPAALAAVAALALRLERDTWLRFALMTASLVLAAGAGTRVVLPGLLAAAVAWVFTARRLGAWRGWLVESAPWVLYMVIAIRPMVLRTVAGLEEGLDRASSGRLEILSEYWAHAQTSLLTGKGIGATDRLLYSGQVDVEYQPHNGFMTLMIDVGIPAMIIALVGIVAYVVFRAVEVNGEAAWLLRVPLLVLLPALFVLDHALIKALLTVPITLFAAAAPWLSRELAARQGAIGQNAPRLDSTATTVLPSRNRSYPRDQFSM